MKKIIDFEVRVLPDLKKFDLKRENFLKLMVFNHKKIKTSLNQIKFSNLLKTLNKNNVNFFVISGLHFASLKNLKINNNFLIKIAKNYPKKIKVFLNIDVSNKQNFYYSLNLIKNNNLKNIIGFECYYNDVLSFQNHKKKINQIIKYINKKNLFFRMIGRHPHQVNGNFYKDIVDVICKMKPKNFMLTALGGGITNYSMIKKIFKKIKNIYFTTTVSANLQFVEIASKFINNKILFGTDYPFNHFNNYSIFLKKFSKLNLTNEEKKNIMYKNAKKFF